MHTIQEVNSMKQTQLFERSNKLLTKKMRQYLVPTMVTMAALSLNEFLDSMMVSVLLDSQALAIVNLGLPVMLCMAAVYTLLGNGGATLYAICIGKRENDTAGKIFRISFFTGLVSGLLFLVLGILFLEPLANILCKDAALLPMFKYYLRALLISAPFLTTILTFVEFLTPSGAPAIATAVNIVANGIGVGMDYVYIKYFDMGVNAAAWATLTGYGVAALLIAYVLLTKKVNIYYSKLKPEDIKLLGEIIKLGGPSAVSQFGYSLKFGFCNGLAIAYGGAAGVVSYSLCNQVNSVVSIFLAAIAGASMPLIAILHGQRDFKGESGVLKTALKYQFIVSVISFLVFFIFPGQVTRIYHITNPVEIDLATKAIRIFAILYLFRGFYMIFMKYLQVLKKTTYAMLISIFDGFAGIIPISFVMCKLFGINGLWFSFGLNTLIIFVVVLFINKRIAKSSDGVLNGILLSSHEDIANATFDVTIQETEKSISSASKQLMQFCLIHDIDQKSATYASLAIEEMAIYSKHHMSRNDYMDILAKLYKDRIEIEFRTLGNTFNPLEITETDIAVNLKLLQGISSSLNYNYIMGMNCTQISIKKKGNNC